jgi:hypothetical protein
MRRWLRLPSGIALLLGLGALAGGEARGDAPQDRQVGATAPGDLLIRSGTDGVSISEGGRGFEPLQLGDTPEARTLKQMLAQDRGVSNEAGVRVNPTILAGGGGAGFHWAPAPTQPNSGAPVTSGPETPPAQPAPSKNTDAPGDNISAPDKQG